jgi:hypothetical protein
LPWTQQYPRCRRVDFFAEELFFFAPLLWPNDEVLSWCNDFVDLSEGNTGWAQIKERRKKRATKEQVTDPNDFILILPELIFVMEQITTVRLNIFKYNATN